MVTFLGGCQKSNPPEAKDEVRKKAERTVEKSVLSADELFLRAN